MGKLSIGRRVLGCISISSDLRSSCFCISDRLIEESEDGKKKKKKNQLVMLKDVVMSAKAQTLAFQLKPKMVVLNVSMHSHGCAKKAKKHVSKMEGVTSYEVDMEKKMVVIFGDIVPYEVLESVSKVKKMVVNHVTPIHNL